MDLLANRIFFSDNGTLIDISREMNNFRSETRSFAVTAAEDAIYIGSDLAFNHRYFDLGATPNATACDMTVSLYDGNSFESAFDIIDKTKASAGTAAFAQSGEIVWSPGKNQQWASRDTDQITELNSISILDKFWAKLTFSADITVDLNYIGHKFCEDEDLTAYYAILANSSIKEQFETGKTDWADQIFYATQYMITKLRSNSKTVTSDQILKSDQFTIPCIHKVAEIVFTCFGDDYRDNLQDAKAEFADTFKTEFFEFDTNSNARVDRSERIRSTGLERN